MMGMMQQLAQAGQGMRRMGGAAQPAVQPQGAMGGTMMDPGKMQAVMRNRVMQELMRRMMGPGGASKRMM